MKFNPVNRTATIVGLIVAWGGVAALVSPLGRLLGPPENRTTQVLGELILWGLLAAVIAIVILWEKEPLASMGLRAFLWTSVAWGLAFAAAVMYLVMPVLAWILQRSGTPGFESGIAKVLVLPLWVRVFAVLTAGIVEDGLFLGYAFTRLTRLTQSYWIAGVISVIVSSFLHLPHWGIGPVMAFVVAEALGTAFFVWRQDLLANMIAHVIVDGMAFVISPIFSR